MAAESQAAGGGLGPEFIWLFGAAVFGFSVVARRSQGGHDSSGSTTIAYSQGPKPELATE